MRFWKAAALTREYEKLKSSQSEQRVLVTGLLLRLGATEPWKRDSALTKRR